MITGFKLRITSAELAKHCRDRSAYHERRADEKEAELPSLKAAAERLRIASEGAPSSLAGMTKGGGGYHHNPADAVQDLEADIRDHRNKSLVFSFFADHLFEEDYTLEETDLVRLEILRR